MTLTCLCCGYDVGSDESPNCPECGAAMDRAHRGLSERRVAFDRAFTAEVRRHRVLSTCLAALFGVVAFVAWRREPLSLYAAVPIGVSVVAAYTVGVVAMALTPAQHRRVIQVGWYRTCWWLIAMWPPSLVTVGAVLGVGMLEGRVGSDGDVLIGVTLLAFGGSAGVGLLLLVLGRRRFVSFVDEWWPTWAVQGNERALVARFLLGFILLYGVLSVILQVAGVLVAFILGLEHIA